MHAKARVMSEIEEVQEQMKADIEAMKEKMTIMMEAMMSIRKMMEVSTTTIIAASTLTEVDSTHPFSLNQANRLASDKVSQGGEALGSAGGSHFVQVQSKHSFHHMPCLLTIHHPILHMLPMRVPITPLPHSLRANNPSLVRHRSLNPWGRHMKYPETTLKPTPSLASDMPLRSSRLVAYPCQTLWGALSITQNHNPCTLRWEECLLPWWKGKILII